MKDFFGLLVIVAIVALILTAMAYVPTAYTVNHDGHQYLRFKNGGVVHDPECPCQGE